MRWVMFLALSKHSRHLCHSTHVHPRPLQVGPPRSNLAKKFFSLFDQTVTINTLINEGVVYAAMGVW